MRRLRLVVHALDRTGPPVLARTFAAWLAQHRPDLAVDLVAFRGGPLVDELPASSSVTVLLDPHEAWDHHRPDPGRTAELQARTARLPPADVVLLVSVAAGQVLPLLAATGAVVTWVVEQGEDLHWLDAPVGLTARTTCWLAGGPGSWREVTDRLPGIAVGSAPEFVAEPPARADGPDGRERVRRTLGAGPEHVLVVGAGIATTRKAPDLFVELALQLAGDPSFRWAWVGGEDDPLHPLLVREVERLGLADVVRLVPSVAALDPLLDAADVVAHPARLDAFPLVCLHAAALGTPVVGFAEVAALEAMFGPAFRGAPYPDVAALADVVRSLGSASARRSLGAAQQARVRSSFTAAVGAPVLLAHLERAAGSAA